jgi:hypothetical protein
MEASGVQAATSNAMKAKRITSLFKEIIFRFTLNSYKATNKDTNQQFPLIKCLN